MKNDVLFYLYSILFSADLQLSQLQQQYINAYVGLYKARGGWLTEPDRGENASDANREYETTPMDGSRGSKSGWIEKNRGSYQVEI